MGTPGIDALDAKINALGLFIGNIVYSGDMATMATASKPLYVDASNKLAAAAIPFSLPVSGGTVTSATFFNITGASTGEANTQMTYPLVAGGNVTTFTKTGFIKVTVTDSAGNVTNGDHYIQIGTLT